MTQNPSPFRRLHERTLVLPNAWDGASAALFAAAGAPAIATTSAGVAWSLGYQDSQGAPIDEMIAALARIVAVSPVPVTADIEAGYGDAAATVARIIALGVSGINLEDSEGGALVDPATMRERIIAVREVAAGAGADLFVNARIDTYLFGVENALDATLERGAAYVDAGADGIFVPGLADLEAMRVLSGAITVPLNVMVAAGSPPVADLEDAGVRRISTGMALAHQAWAVAAASAVDILTEGHFDAIDPGVEYGRLNGLLRTGG
ncbi:isocitrate lyase/PEP mutase family protein [Microbacterium sulfonylureivorans]|uniref:isocitrate lyase/PEP mutase family protein n=1 Tax=Microbacterium sulfonylureivorans TaxID=2486854 RepID=UPI000FD82928|nr:isocitrate lyase/phosphoenolpyruvate mutase family protein [Microbacterium sulfonylureivorans]